MLKYASLVLLSFLLYTAAAQQQNITSSDNMVPSPTIVQPIEQSNVTPEISGAFFASFTMILVSEIGDKTFFIAALMAMQNKQSVIFLAAMTALFFMTVFSSILGLMLPALIDPKLTGMIAVGLFVFFGFKMLIEAYRMDGEHLKDEMNEVEEELHKHQLLLEINEDEQSNDMPAAKQAKLSYLHVLLGPIFVQCLTMTFLAEWGDRSQIATIALAAAHNPLVVIIGATLGHMICSGLAVVGGSLLASRINERTISAVGGCLFLMFAAHALIMNE